MAPRATDASPSRRARYILSKSSRSSAASPASSRPRLSSSYSIRGSSAKRLSLAMAAIALLHGTDVIRVIGEQISVQRHAAHIAFRHQGIAAGETPQCLAHCDRNRAMKSKRKLHNGLLPHFCLWACAIGGGSGGLGVICGGVRRHVASIPPAQFSHLRGCAFGNL